MRAGLSGSPPAVSATSSVELQPAAWGGGGLRGSKSRRSSAQSTAPFCGIRPQFKRPKPAGPKATSVAGLRGERLRPARLCESQEHSPKLVPVPCPVSASLRLRYRSAAFSRAWGNPVKTHKCILTISLFRRRRASSSVPDRTVLFVNKENQKNFRRMLTHPQAAGGHNLGARATLSKAETTLTKRLTSPRRDGAILRVSLIGLLCPILFHVLGAQCQPVDQPLIWAPVALVKADEMVLIIRSISLSVKVLVGSSRTKFRA